MGFARSTGEGKEGGVNSFTFSGRFFGKSRIPLRKNVVIWQYPTGKGLTVCQVQKGVGHPFVHRNSFLKVAGKVAVAQITCRSVLL